MAGPIAAPEDRASVSNARPEIAIREQVAGEDFTAFRTLNEEWITRHFVLEPKDVATLADPETAILGKGGHVYTAFAGDQAVGCVALLPMADGVYELSKMAVAPGMRGRGIGRRVLSHAIEEARALGARALFLGSSTKLPEAVHLYEGVGFGNVPRGPGPTLR